ncbi:hypothetical protein QYE76_041294 [Lolium multiflorum]|uniref:Uncharacterized protein n=1 Tax=Lolium multiflorum TaxID=4521 RepID=A0AAD8WVX4_LOLMU|nr:hypothetical protein QYE76_041294 [Lolium multiflorum]
MYPPHDSHESVRYWNAGWFYEKNVSVPEIHDSLPKFNNEPPEELASWSFVPSLALTPILEKAARRISWLVHDGLTGTQLTLSWFTRRIQPLRSILWRRKTFAPYFVSPSVATRRRRFRMTKRRKRSRHPQGSPRPSKRPRAKAPGSAGASGEASAKKPKTIKPPPLDSRKAERERLKMLATAGKRSRPIIPGAPIPATAATRTTSQEPITKYMKKSPAVGPPTPAPPSTSHTAPPPSPPQAEQSPPPAANTPPEVIPVSSEKVGGEDPKAKGPAREETEVQGQGEAEVTSSEKVGVGVGDIVVFPKNFGDPADLTSTPKAYATKFFNKLTEAEKWELEQDLLNAMLNNAWGKPDAATSEIQEFKKDVGQFDKLICKQKEQQALHYELHKNIALQRRVTLGQAENIQTLKNENAELNKQLADAQGASSSLATTSSELENLRSSYQELETKLMEAEQKKEQAEKHLAERNSEFIKEKGEFVLKKNVDSETIKRQQKELNGLRKYMETAERHWDLLTENLLDVGALLDAVSGYDTRIARRIRHEEFYDKFTWTSSKDAPQEEPKSSAATSEEEEESEEDVSSPAEDAKEKDPEGDASPSKAE